MPDSTHLVMLLLGAALGAAGVLALRARNRQATAPVVAEAPESLTARLHRLAASIESFAERSAHPRELGSAPEFGELVAAFRDPSVTPTTLREYVFGDSWTLSSAALAALAARDDRNELADAVSRDFRLLRPWALHYGLNYLLSLDPRPAVGLPLACAQAWWAQNAVIPGLFRDYMEERSSSGDPAGFGESLSGVDVDAAAIEALLKRIDHPYAESLLGGLRRWQSTTADRAFLESFGRLWSEASDGDFLAEPDAWQPQLAAAQAAVLREDARSVIVSGEPRTGKTSFVRLLGRRLAKQGWTVFEAGAADLMAGQVYIGELEARLQRLTRELATEKRHVWYVPDLLALANSGSHRGHSATILEQVMPALVAGRIVVIGETTPAGATRVLQNRATLRSRIEAVRLEPMDEREAEALARRLGRRIERDSALRVDDASIPAATHLVKQYLGSSMLPGALLDLLKLSAQRCVAERSPVLAPRGLLATLSQVTGLPEAILDDGERLDLATVRQFFAERVIGQDEAVETIVERIAMLKAGLTDASRPVGVFMFAGPTGTGKTELAKSLAEYLFGSAERLVRLDMSEFQSLESMAKILGGPAAAADSDSLVDRVRKQPFSVLLLDEFEKAHASIWDLFLQVFDDGRLSDATGQVADFRHCIIIMTSNLGATAHQGRDIGFNPSPSAFSPEQVARTIGQTFRPEFVNRFDRVIVFRPLTRQLMRRILQKELSSLRDRRGLRNREWAVEWEDSAQEFLLDRGFTPELGARPLKRAIDRYVLAPLAATMVEHKAPEGDQFLFVRSDGRDIQVEFVDPDAEDPASPPVGPIEGSGPELAAMVLQPRGTAEELRELETLCEQAAGRLQGADWEALKDSLAGEMAHPEFWTRPDRQRVLARFAAMDRVKAAVDTAVSLRDRLGRSSGASGRVSRQMIERLALQLHLVGHGVADVIEESPVEVALAVDTVLEGPANPDPRRSWQRSLLDMYRAWAAARRVQVSEIPLPGRDEPALLMSGFGAHRCLAPEAGLHVLELDGPPDGGQRVVARVRVIPSQDVDWSDERQRHRLADSLEHSDGPGQVVRRYRRDPSPLVRDARKGWRTGRIDLVMAGNFDLVGGS